MTADEYELLPELQSTQEEADTRLLHASHASLSGYQSIIIVSDDTDAFPVCLAFQEEITASLYVKAGTQARVQYIDTSFVASSLVTAVCKAILGLHSFTGCDTTSAFAGRGKTNALKIMMGNAKFTKTFQELGSDWGLSLALFQSLQAFTCCMYASKTRVLCVNELRYQLFVAKKGQVEVHQFPHCEEALYKHCQRANFQAAVWRHNLSRIEDRG